MIKDFIFDGKSAKDDFGLYIVDINNSSDTTSDVSIRNISSFQPANNDRVIWTSTENGEALNKKIELVHMVDCEGIELTDDDIDKIARWFSREDGFHKFSWVTDDNNEYFYNVHINISKIYFGGKIIGLEFDITTDSHYTFKNINETFNVTSGEIIRLYDYSSRFGIKPMRLEISNISKSTFQLIHVFNNKEEKTVITSCNSNEKIIISESKTIYSSDTNHDIADCFNYVFPVISNNINDEKNLYVVNCDCVITFEYLQRRKVGI